jgi:hypothetical protein
MSSQLTKLSRAGGIYGHLVATHGPDAKQVQEARRNHIAARIEARAADLMDGVLPLTDEQIADIVSVLKGEQ